MYMYNIIKYQTSSFKFAVPDQPHWQASLASLVRSSRGHTIKTAIVITYCLLALYLQFGWHDRD